MVEDLQPERLGGLIRGRWGRSLTVKERTASTMDDASSAAADGADDGHVVLADQQTRGRGAHGRQWDSPPRSDLYFSVVARPAVEPASTALVTLASGLGVRDAAASFVPGRAVRVKWPNDIWIERRKCAGILVESRTLGVRIDSVIIGVGLNVNRMQWPEELKAVATSLRAEAPSQKPLDRAEALAAALFHMERWVNRLVKDGAAVVVDALRPSLALLGERIRFEGGEGTFEGIDHDGAALVRTQFGLRALHAAHIERVDD